MKMLMMDQTLWLLLAGTVWSQGSCQHWSYGLSPGGKRDLDSLPDPLAHVIKDFPHEKSPCRVLCCDEEATLPRVYRVKGFLDRLVENGQRTYEK